MINSLDPKYGSIVSRVMDASEDRAPAGTSNLTPDVSSMIPPADEEIFSLFASS
jgi:hypothetical protein